MRARRRCAYQASTRGEQHKGEQAAGTRHRNIDEPEMRATRPGGQKLTQNCQAAHPVRRAATTAKRDPTFAFRPSLRDDAHGVAEVAGPRRRARRAARR